MDKEGFDNVWEDQNVGAGLKLELDDSDEVGSIRLMSRERVIRVIKKSLKQAGDALMMAAAAAFLLGMYLLIILTVDLGGEGKGKK